MSSGNLNPKLKSQILSWQKAEITGQHIYGKLAGVIKDPHNRELLEGIAQDEAKHYKIFRNYTDRDVSPSRLRILIFYWIARILGLTFGIKLMERGERAGQEDYARLRKELPEMEQIIGDEEKHEHGLIEMLDEDALRYAGSVVLGLNDALVELTGALAGLTLAFRNTRLIALTGLITGIAASFSMAASEYLSVRAGGQEEHPVKSALYTGVAYVFTVMVLIMPYLILPNYMMCLAWTLVNAILIIAVFNFYLSVAKDLSFRNRFLEMAIISMGVAVLSFGVGYVIRKFFGIEV